MGDFVNWIGEGQPLRLVKPNDLTGEFGGGRLTAAKFTRESDIHFGDRWEI